MRRVESPASVAVWALASTVSHRENTVNILTDFLPDFDHPELKFSYKNLKFGQNRSYRGREDLQLLFWAKVDMELELGRKTCSNSCEV